MSDQVSGKAYVGYSSNNSGGYWWLSDRDWEALEEAGWVVDWVKSDPAMKGLRDANGTWLGAKATNAKRYGLPLELAIAEWSMITGQSAEDEGCDCCGQPHNFYSYDENGRMIW
jgi:hypothetical protein